MNVTVAFLTTNPWLKTVCLPNEAIFLAGVEDDNNDATINKKKY